MNPFTFLLILDCIRGPCLEKNSCHDQYGEMQTAKLQGCIAQNCEKALMQCTFQTVQDIVTEMKKEDPSVSTEALLDQAVTAVLNDIKSFLNCFKEIGKNPIDAAMCFLESFLRFLGDTPQQDNNKKPPFMSNNRDSFFCWIRASIKRVMNCINQDNLHMLSALEHFGRSKEYSECIMKMFPYWSKNCLPASFRLFGNIAKSQFTGSQTGFADCITSWNRVTKECRDKTLDLQSSMTTIPVQIKDLYICTINEMILATTTC
ncbi:uncharacterized protein LOC132892660 [Neoarius graeffei]|uniref:uncharacterized protein LOC132892660 n=1 Tax=Neoarius graeffei TaxID=443677 RepID=UPI00298D3D5E|nr:uncharacterized protein LOC132892660 [Neoarius graeffei]XP_060786952.1 uncharacterized protein LOC132892660 [Neoarius graeffei]XP_060786953.1 uncharacterized protein LOC132892660 [Neoarius graeffei]